MTTEEPGPTCSEFDYGCDDCILPWNHYDHPEINNVQPEQPFPEAF